MQPSNFPTSMDAQIKVSVLVTTYNHEKFIAQAINSILIQVTNFDYKVVIIEDYSTDRTREIVIDFQKRYPNKIRLVLAEKNQNDNSIWEREILGVQSQYIALLDGDDYWTSPDKLQKQMDFLDQHPECAICFHNVTAFYEDVSREAYSFNQINQKEISTLEDLWAGNFIANCSVMLRSGLLGQFPSWFCNVKWADWALYILYARHGKIGYINEVMAAYRVHSRGLWSGLTKVQQLEEVIEFYENMNANLKFVYDKIIRTWISYRYYELALEYEKRGNWANARINAVKCIGKRPFNRKLLLNRQLYNRLLSLLRMLTYNFHMQAYKVS